jgi:hypothetical protein
MSWAVDLALGLIEASEETKGKTRGGSVQDRKKRQGEREGGSSFGFDRFVSFVCSRLLYVTVVVVVVVVVVVLSSSLFWLSLFLFPAPFKKGKGKRTRRAATAFHRGRKERAAPSDNHPGLTRGLMAWFALRRSN